MILLRMFGVSAGVRGPRNSVSVVTVVIDDYTDLQNFTFFF